MVELWALGGPSSPFSLLIFTYHTKCILDPVLSHVQHETDCLGFLKEQGASHYQDVLDFPLDFPFIIGTLKTI